MHSDHEWCKYILIYLAGLVLVQLFDDIVADDSSFVGRRAGRFAGDWLREVFHGTKRRPLLWTTERGCRDTRSR
jgi:hypothetical protein